MMLRRGTFKYSVFPVDAVKGQRYKDRVQIQGNNSLSITRLSVDDAGAYCCKTTETVRGSPVVLSVEGEERLIFIIIQTKHKPLKTQNFYQSLLRFWLFGFS